MKKRTIKFCGNTLTETEIDSDQYECGHLTVTFSDAGAYTSPHVRCSCEAALNHKDSDSWADIAFGKGDTKRAAKGAAERNLKDYYRVMRSILEGDIK